MPSTLIVASGSGGAGRPAATRIVSRCARRRSSAGIVMRN
jgi:hypothetical protein